MKKMTCTAFSRMRLACATFFGVVMMMLLNSCGSAPDTDKMLETIPGEALFVARLDAGKFIDNAGITLKDDKYVLSDDLEKLVEQLPSDGQDAVENILKALPAFDVKSFMFYMYDLNKVVATCALEHEKEVKLALEKELGKPLSEDGFDVFDTEDGNIVIAIKDNQLWISDKLKTITKALDRADKKNFSENEAAKEYLLADHAFVLTANMASIYDFAIGQGGRAIETQLEMVKDYKDSFVCMALDLEGPTVKYTASMVGTNGKAVVPFQACETIGTDFLSLVPQNSMLVAAFGAPTTQYLDYMNKVFNYRREEISKFIDGIDGTVAFAITPPSDLRQIADINNWGFTIMAHMPQHLSSELMNKLAENLNDGYHYTTVAEGDQYHVTSRYRGILDSRNMYYGVFNGYFVVSTKRIETGTPDATLKKEFEGERMAAFATASKDSQLLSPLGLPFGAEARLTGDSTAGALSLTLTGTSQKFIEAIIALASNQRLQRNIMEAAMTYSTSYNDYDTYAVEDSLEMAETWEAEAVAVESDDYYNY